MTEFSRRLKLATSYEHEEMERNTLSTRLMSESVDIATYIIYLRKLLGFVEPFERLADGFFNDWEEKPSRMKQYLIRQDLAGLGENSTNVDTIDMEKFRRIFDNEHKLLGAFYMIEGSSLGGVLINRHIEAKLGSEVGDNNRYFSAYEGETGKKWKSFQEYLNLKAGSEREQVEIIEGARAAFVLLNQWMSN